MPIVVTSSTTAAAPVTFSALLDELYGRGFDYLNQDSAGQTRAKRWVNQSYQQLCEEARWPFTEATATGLSPLSIPDLREVESVRGTVGQRLQWLDRRTLIDSFGDLTTAGSGRYWYIEAGNSLSVYPTGDTVTVRYHKVPKELVNDFDEVVVPPRFADLIVDGAAIRAYKDSDNFEAVAALKQEWLDGVERMKRSLLYQHNGPEYIVEVTGSDDTGWF